MPDTDKQVMHLRIPAPLHARIAAFAKDTRRSLNSATVWLLENSPDLDTIDDTDLHLRSAAAAR